MKNIISGVVLTGSLFFGFPYMVFAAPSVSSVSGALTHNNTITVSGSGFGTKATAAPTIWDDASTGTLPTDGGKWSGFWPDNNPSYNAIYRNPLRGIGLPHSHVTRYIAGAHGENTGFNSGYNVIVFKTFSFKPSAVYASWYVRADDNWQFCSDGVSDNNFKDFAYSIGYSPYEMPNNLYANHQGLSSKSASPQWTAIDDGAGLSLTSPDMNGHGVWWSQGPNYMAGSWTKVEVEMKVTSGTDGFFRLYENGQRMINYVGRTDAFPTTVRTVGIGGYAVCSGRPSNWRYYSDVYLDTALSRVVLADNATLANATIIEPQIPSSWSAGSITAAVNLGQFTTGTAYLYVVDNTGAVNTNGFPVTVGGAPDTTPPAAPTGLAVE